MINEKMIPFAKLGLIKPILNALNDLGYKKPSPIQEKCIPYLLEGLDVLGMAQTGSGKTAAFGLPLLQNIKIHLSFPQILVLLPTRELAIQVAEEMKKFSKHMNEINIVALYGGQRYDIQFKILKNGPQIVVGTPGRLLDHLNRGTLNLSHLNSLVLDEADEMLRMGFIEDVKKIINCIPKKHQTALFSATMPHAIRNITNHFMKLPKEIRIESNIDTQPNIYQNYWIVYGIKKKEALIRFLESENFDAAIVFVRTKNATLEISSILEKNGYNSSALNGDMNQSLREETLERLRNGNLDILIATDVAARGLDVDRITLVINYDIPIDAKSYIHRIGRTGRAGRKGRAILFINNREKRLLYNIKRMIKQPISEIKLPTSTFISQKRQIQFTENIENESKKIDFKKYKDLIYKIIPPKMNIETLAIILLKIAEGKKPLILPKENIIKEKIFPNKKKKLIFNKKNKKKYSKFKKMKLFRIEIGKHDGVETRNIVGAILNESKINSSDIGYVKIHSSYSIIELSEKIPKKVFKNISYIKILHKSIKITQLNAKKIKKQKIIN
ncbi:MAG: DEAD/DEAH box helicase [Arsenophonus sp.]|nr:MAG: DEAD/DEAH box helicase [Arsenophonus sp.]